MNELEKVQLETAQLQLEEQKERNERFKAEKADKSRKNAQRQQQLKSDRANREKISAQCKHRQGGTPANPYNGKGATSLNVAKLPDGFTKVIMCTVCRLRCFTPHPADGSKKQRKGESADQREMRVEKYLAAKETYERLLEQSKDTLTEEAAQEMDCGTYITLVNEDGANVLPRRPCDSYASA
jgi:hypothetical protein